MRTRIRISKGGQISIPATVRRRWGTQTLSLDDQGDRLVLEPAPDDPIAAAEGALARYRLDPTGMRRTARRDDEAAARRR